MIKVAQLIGSMGVFGAERWILALMSHLDSRRVECCLVNLVDEPGETSAVVQEARKRGLKAFDLYTGGRFNPLAAWRLGKWVRQNGYHILHSHGYKSDFVAFLAAKLCHTKVISTPHGWSKEPDLKLKLYENLDRFLLCYFDCVCPLSSDLESGLIKSGIPKHKIRTILNAVDLDEIKGITPAQKDSDKMVIGYVGQLIARKNLKVLLRAFKEVIKHKKEAVLTLVGDGPLRSELEKQVLTLNLKKNVIFTGYRPDAVSLLKNFTIFVLPSLLEGIPRCLMETMAVGVPVVASDIPGNRTLVEHGKTGLLFPANDAQKLAEAILYLLNHPEEARQITQNARTKIEKKFSAQRMAREYMGLYYTLAG